MSTLRAALLSAALLAGCGTYGDDDSAASGYAPEISWSSPTAGVQVLVDGGVLDFIAEGGDTDSVDLDWSWLLDDELQAFGSSDDGTFYTEWALHWSPELAGTSVDVGFEVSDGEQVTTLYWPVDVDVGD